MKPFLLFRSCRGPWSSPRSESSAKERGQEENERRGDKGRKEKRKKSKRTKHQNNNNSKTQQQQRTSWSWRTPHPVNADMSSRTSWRSPISADASKNAHCSAVHDSCAKRRMRTPQNKAEQTTTQEARRTQKENILSKLITWVAFSARQSLTLLQGSVSARISLHFSNHLGASANRSSLCVQRVLEFVFFHHFFFLLVNEIGNSERIGASASFAVALDHAIHRRVFSGE